MALLLLQRHEAVAVLTYIAGVAICVASPSPNSPTSLHSSVSSSFSHPPLTLAVGYRRLARFSMSVKAADSAPLFVPDSHFQSQLLVCFNSGVSAALGNSAQSLSHKPRQAALPGLCHYGVCRRTPVNSEHTLVSSGRAHRYVPQLVTPYIEAACITTHHAKPLEVRAKLSALLLAVFFIGASCFQGTRRVSTVAVYAPLGTVGQRCLCALRRAVSAVCAVWSQHAVWPADVGRCGWSVWWYESAAWHMHTAAKTSTHI